MNFELFYFMTEYSNIEQNDLVPDKEKTKKNAYSTHFEISTTRGRTGFVRRSLPPSYKRKRVSCTVGHYSSLLLQHHPTDGIWCWLHRPLLSRNRARLDVPDLLGILGDGTVAAELAAPSSVQDGHLDPFLLIPVTKPKKSVCVKFKLQDHVCSRVCRWT